MDQPEAELAYEELQTSHVGRFHQLLPELEQRLTWDGAALKHFRTEGLRTLVGVDKERSPWHRERLAGIEVGDLTIDDRADLPVMTKADLMANFDDIVTDPRLTRDLCEQHLESLSRDRYLLEEFHVVASGGSSGQRGVYVYGWDGWATCYSSIVRFSGRERAANPRLDGIRPVMAMVARRQGDAHLVGDQSDLLEPGPAAQDVPRDPAVGGHRRRNPCCRFEVTDQVTVLPGPCPCGSIFRRVADPQGRLDETFIYPGGIEVHPHIFRSLLGEEGVIEYQVRQTAAGADIHVVTTDAFDASTVSGGIEAALRRLGLSQPEVRVAVVAELHRQTTGKLKRFIPLGGGTEV